MNLHEPCLDYKDLENLKKSFKTNWISSGGSFTKKFEELLKKKIKAKNVSCLVNGTSSLQIALKLAGVTIGDEVIVPTTTFIATINSIIYNSADPIFFDIDDYFNLDEEKVIEFLKKNSFSKKNYTYNKISKKRIKALIVVHTFGNAAKFENLKSICDKKNIKIIEDNAEGIGVSYKSGKFKNKFAGTIGFAGCLSFNGNKIITSGGGGAIISKSRKTINQVNHIINQSKVDPINFIHDQVGYNMKICNLNASIGCSQLKKLNKFIKIKKKIHLLYKKKFEVNNNLKIMDTPVYCKSNYWLNILEIHNYKKNSKERILRKLNQKNIFARSVWYPNHLQKPFKRFMSYKIEKAIFKTKTSICLPSSASMKKNDVDRVYNEIINLIKP